MQKLFLLLLFLFVSFLSKANNGDSCLVMNTIRHGLHDTKAIALSPFHWDKTDWMIFSGVSATTAASIAWFDKPINNFTQNHHTKSFDSFFKVVEPMGHTYPLVLAAGFAIHGAVAKSNYSMQTAMIAVESYAFNGVIVQLIKSTAGRSRPDDWRGPDPLRWEGPFHGTSFCSGHTSTAFSVASVIAYRYRDTHWVPYLSYGLATLGGMQRIYQNRHWTSDVIFGAMVGTATGVFLSKTWEKNPLLIFPTFTQEGNGLSVIIPIK